MSPKEAKRCRALRIAYKLASLIGLGLAVGAWSSCRDSSASNASGGGAASGAAATAEVKDVIAASGVDTSAMTPRERRTVELPRERAPRPLPQPCPVPVAQCVLEKRPCGSCLQAAKCIAHAVRDGASAELSSTPTRTASTRPASKTLPLDGLAQQGARRRPGHHRRVRRLRVPPLRPGGLRDRRGDAQPIRTRSASSTRATRCPSTCTASRPPARRWRRARRASSGRWSTCSSSGSSTSRTPTSSATATCSASTSPSGRPTWPRRRSRIASPHDRSLGEDLKLKGTPTIYVNGRELDVEAGDVLEERVAAELGEVGGDASAPEGPAVGPAPSAAASSSGNQGRARRPARPRSARSLRSLASLASLASWPSSRRATGAGRRPEQRGADGAGG